MYRLQQVLCLRQILTLKAKPGRPREAEVRELNLHERGIREYWIRYGAPGDFQQGPKLPADPSALFGKPPANPKKLHLGRGIAQKYQHNLYSQHKAIAMTSGLPEWRQPAIMAKKASAEWKPPPAHTEDGKYSLQVRRRFA